MSDNFPAYRPLGPDRPALPAGTGPLRGQADFARWCESEGIDTVVGAQAT
jgi:hypothetical protein